MFSSYKNAEKAHPSVFVTFNSVTGDYLTKYLCPAQCFPIPDRAAEQSLFHVGLMQKYPLLSETVTNLALGEQQVLMQIGSLFLALMWKIQRVLASLNP